jgi:type I restriction enzyme S subunit
MSEAECAQTEQFIVSQLGLMPKKWRIYDIGSACSLVVDCPHTTPTFRDEGILVARTTNIRDGRFVVEGASYVDEQEYRTRILRAEPQAGDVIFTREAPVGEAFVVPLGMQVCLGQRVMLLRPEPSVLDPIYLLSQISSGFVRSRIATLTAGTTNPHLNVSEVRSFLLPMPPIAEQRRIAEVLDTLNEAIRSTERVIAKLEQAKQGLLRALLTHGIDESGGLRNPDSNPNKFASTRFGPRPANWSVLKLEELIQGRPKNGYSPKEVDQWTGTLMLGLGCLTPSGFRPLQLKNAPLSGLRTERALLNDGDLLISRANTRELVGLSGRFRSLGTPCIYPDLMMRLKPNDRITPEYLEITLRAPETRRQIQAAASGTSGSMVKISSAVVCNLLVAVPDEAEQRRIVAVLNAETSRSDLEERRLTKLRTLKQGLMDDLLTGRVRVEASG